MALKNLLVAYNGGDASDTALHLGALMAQKYDAHLTGIAAHGISSVARNIPSWLASSLEDSINDLAQDHLAELELRFRSFLNGKVPSDKLHWINVSEDPDAAISKYTRLFDVTLLGQYENLPAAAEYELHPDRIAYSSGRPIMVAPKDYRPTQINETAVVAWDGKRTSSRAMFDAMQILETKSEVTVLTIGTVKDPTRPARIDLPTLLRRHGINATQKTVARRSKGIAATILEYCDETNAGLLVMGAYEHSKISEDLFGGVTAEVLSDAQLPVFMSH
jgi:nucleotide-binding universal stress UspA family protein